VLTTLTRTATTASDESRFEVTFTTESSIPVTG
jgi:hypothetical protein